MQLPDLLNGGFELLGGFAIWQNVRKIRQAKQVRGVDWRVTGFFTGWGVWNLYYYPQLGQWASFSGGLVIATGNLVWLWHAWRYRAS